MGAELRFGQAAEAADLAAFLSRAVRLDPAVLVRLRAGGGATAAYVRLPFGVLVSRSARTEEAPTDATVGAAALVAALESTGPGEAAVLPGRRDEAWRGQLPPVGGWQQLDRVPADVVAQLVRSGAATLRSMGTRGAAVGESLLDHQALTVAGGGRTVGLPLRILFAVWRMGFLGDATRDPTTGPAAETVAISMSGNWVRLAAPYGSAYHQATPALLVLPR